MTIEELIKINKKIYGSNIEPKITKLGFDYDNWCSWLFNPNKNQILFIPLGKCMVTSSVFDTDLQDWVVNDSYYNSILYVKDILDYHRSYNIDLKSGFKFTLQCYLPTFELSRIGPDTKILSASNSISYNLETSLYMIKNISYSDSCDQTIFLLEYDPCVQLW